MYYPNKEFTAIAKTQQGLEPLLAEELIAIGARNVEQHKRAVSFTCNQILLYQANLCLRLALKILLPISRFQVKNDKDLYEEVRRIGWKEWMNVDDTLAVDGLLNSKYFNHSQYIALKTKDAIVDYFRDHFGRRPSVDTVHPHLRINVHIFNDECTLSLDSSGDSLHRRGYRSSAAIAPLNEVTAAAMIASTKWDGKGVFIDPMCGSGTILIEAAMHARHMPAGMFRSFAFQRWKDYDEALWKKVYEDAISKIEDTDTKFIGCDKVFKVAEMARENCTKAGLDEYIRLSNKRFEELQPPADVKGIVVVNPPYGERIEVDEINAFYKMMGDVFKQKFSGYDVWILSSNKEAMKKIGLAASKRLTIWNGPLECRFHKFEMYKGSREG
jgi:putative N6-adenine-specific DNA methylase